MRILRELARDERVAPLERWTAASALGQFGQLVEAMASLLALVYDIRMDASVRELAAIDLGAYGNARTLPDLDQIAETDPNQSVRRVAHQAADRIRARLAKQSS